MKFDQLLFLLPCRSLEDLSLQRSPEEAEQLLSAWCALWHPALLAGTQNTPHWAPAEEAPDEPEAHLIVLPPCCESLLPEGWRERVEAAGARVIRGLQHRDQMAAAALQCLEAGAAPVDADLVADFFALAFCHFLIEFLTRQSQYSTNLDEASFRAASLAAATTAVTGDTDESRRQLQAAFDRLHESRDHYYAAQPHLLDLTLVAPSMLGESLRGELAGERPVNLLIGGELIEQMARQEPATLAALNDAVANNTAAIIGGEFQELPLPLLPPEAIRGQLKRGLTAYEKHLGQRPTVFGRRTFGLTPALPQILNAQGFAGAMHFTLDDGRFPTSNQSRIQWEGVDGTMIEALARVPIDASRADAFLGLPEQLGNTLDSDYAATVVLAHWPGRSSPWYDDLRRISAYTSVVGAFLTITQYFEQTSTAGQRTQFPADQYRSPYLAQSTAAGRADPISRWVRYYRRRAGVEAAQTLDFMTAACTLSDCRLGSRDWAPQMLLGIDERLRAANDDGGDLDAQLQKQLDESLARFSQAASDGEKTPPGCEPIQANAAKTASSEVRVPIPSAAPSGYLLANPTSLQRRISTEIPALGGLPEVSGPVRAAGESAGRRTVVVDVPAMGFAWVGPAATSDVDAKSQPAQTKGKSEPPLAEENLLRNEFFEVAIDRDTGAIRSISAYNSRRPRLAQQVAMRLPGGNSDDPGHDSNYSIMATDEVLVTSPGPVLGEIVCRGRLVDRQARRLAGFTQTTRVWRGSRVIELDIELDVEQLPGPNPWNSYYAARFAWAEPAAELHRSVNLVSRPTEVDRLEAPHFIDIRVDALRTTLLCGGLPYHRRFGPRRLDTLLVVQGETARRFRLAVGIDLPSPAPAAIGLLTPPTLAAGTPTPTPAAWLFHLDARHVVATHWEPIVGEKMGTGSEPIDPITGKTAKGEVPVPIFSRAGRMDGLRVRLLETQGRSVQLGLRCCREVKSARKIMPGNAAVMELPVEGDRVTVDLGPHAWVEVEVLF